MDRKTRRSTGIVSLLAGMLGLVVVPALAHHSFAMFDFTKTVEISGTVKQLEWTNPHSFLHLTVVDAKGKTSEWSFEMGGPGVLATQGFKPKIVIPGDKVTVWMHPMKDGSGGGAFLSMKLPDGRQLGMRPDGRKIGS